MDQKEQQKSVIWSEKRLNLFNDLIWTCEGERESQRRKGEVKVQKLQRKLIKSRAGERRSADKKKKNWTNYWWTVESKRNTKLYPAKHVRIELFFLFSLKIKALRQSIHRSTLSVLGAWFHKAHKLWSEPNLSEFRM